MNNDLYLIKSLLDALFVFSGTFVESNWSTEEGELSSDFASYGKEVKNLVESVLCNTTLTITSNKGVYKVN